MRVGVAIFPTDLSIRIDVLAREAEARGFRALFVPEHTHIPAGRKTPWPGGGDLPDEYRRLFDPFVALAAAGAVTENMLLGTGICLVAQHDPIVLAKQVASLDALSGGRFVFGVGFGWNVDEMEHHGVDPDRRRATVRDKILAMKELWTKDEAAFDGRYASFSLSWSWPKPVQRPHPPVIIGGSATPTVFKHVVEWADGWMPIDGRGDVLAAVGRLREQSERSGRDPASLRITVFAARPDPERLDAYRQAGVETAVLMLPPREADVVLPVLDRRAAVLEQVGV